MSKYVELEIQRLLRESTPAEQVAAHLISNLESSAAFLTPENVSATVQFLFHSGQYLSLIEFVLRHIDDKSFQIPWPHFLEALQKGAKNVDQKAVEALWKGVEQTQSIMEAAKATSFVSHAPQLQEAQRERRQKIQQAYLEKKNQLLEQLVILRTQELVEEEKDLLNSMQALYPGDAKIQSEVTSHRQRYALEILARRKPGARSAGLDFLHQRDTELEKAALVFHDVLLEAAEQEPTLAKDLAIAAYVIESYDTALEIMNLIPTEDASFAWLRLEILLAGRRFVELLAELSEVELALAHDPETFFATSYLRAQAYWGLGQKHTALEVIEGLLASRPHYRSASTLQSLWSSQ